MEINKGDKFYCIRDVYMVSGARRYNKGEFYYSEENNCITNIGGNVRHEWIDDEWTNYFEKVEDEKVIDPDIGQKHDLEKLPYYTVFFRQFPNALREIVKCSKAGHAKYSETDKDWMNFTRLENTETRYREAMLRHMTEDGPIEDMKPYGEMTHEAAVAWNALADLENKLIKTKK